MDTPMDSAPRTQTAAARQTVANVARWWWAWLVSGAIWILASVFILQFRSGSVTLVGIIIGVMFLVAGIEELAVGTVSESGGWRWLWYVFGAILVVGGIYALFNPVGTFLAVADVLGFVLVLVGIFWTIEAFATRPVNPMWWLGLIAGILTVVLGFWAGGQFLATQAYALLVIAGIWALFHGISDIIKAFMIREAGALVAS